MNKVRVDLKERSYDILIGQGTLKDIGATLKGLGKFDKIIIITDPLVNDLYGEEVRRSIKSSGFRVETIDVPRGERYKSFEQAERLFDKLVDLDVHRDSCIVALGGGVIGDLAGFVAATYMRGVTLVHVPTTLLAQVDSSIGGKTAVNHPKCKNLIGSFYQPKLVYIDVLALATLPERELRTGLAEVIKYGVIEDASFFKFLEANAHHLNTKAFEDKETTRAAMELWQTIVAESCKIKARIVVSDETEQGLRMILNFGHTVGHAIETLTKYKSYNHGEAISIGMVAESMIANETRLFSKEAVERIRELLEKIGLPTMAARFNTKKVIKTLAIDKKVRGGKIQFVLPSRIGEVEVKRNVPVKVLRKVLKENGCR